MPEDPVILRYSANERRRIAPTRSDWYIALFSVIAGIAGLIGFVGIASMAVMWIKPAWFHQPEPLPWWVFAIGFAFYGLALALAFFAARLARRRARPAG
jgi:hypothetical protein